MSRAYPFILTCLLLSLGSQVEAADTLPASQARTSSAPSTQDLDAISAMAEQGDAGSQNYLGFLYATGQSVAKDEKKAFAWFQKAADQGYPEALGNLAMMYEKGLGVAKNLHTALTLHRQAAMAGYPISMKRLASLYESGLAGEERDPIKAEMWKTRYKESQKTSTPAASDALPRQAQEKAPTAVQSDKLPAAKPVAPSATTPPQATTASVPGDTPAKPVPPPSSNKASAAADPYFIQIGGKTTARETMEVAQKIIEKNLLPKNKKIEFVNPNGKSYTINIGPFADAHQAAPYKAKIMALLNAAPAPAPEPARTQAVPAEMFAAPRPQIQAAPVAATPPPLPAQTAARPAEKPVVVAAIPAVTAPASTQPKPVPLAASPSTKSAAAEKTEAVDKGKSHYVEISGKATALEATKLIQKIVKKGILPKNMHVELINLDSDYCRIRIGPFADAREAAPQIAKINASAKNTLAPPTLVTSQELVPVVAPVKQPAPPTPATLLQKPLIAPTQLPSPPAAAPKIAAAPIAANIPAAPAPIALPQKQEIPPPRIALAAAPKAVAVPIAGDTPKLTEQKPATAKVVRDRYYFIQMDAKVTFEDSMFLTQFLLAKELAQEAHRVKIENMDGQSFRISIGPFSDAKEARLQLQKINRQTFQALSVVTLEKLAPISGEDHHEPFIQVNAKTTLDNALALTQTLKEMKLLAPKMFAEIVNFGNGNYRVRFGPFKGTKEAGQSIKDLKKKLKTPPVLVNLERLVSAEDN